MLIRLAYSLLGVLLLPLLGVWLVRRACKGKERFGRLGERFGIARAPRPHGKLVWLHAASVGEAQSVLTLLRSLLTQHPDTSCLITTGTLTSAALIAAQHLPRTTHQFLPLDTLPTTEAFLRHWKPDMVLWVESEFWPQMLWRIRARRIPTLLVNARMSARSAQRWKTWPRTIGYLLGGFDTLYAGSTPDAERLRVLGGTRVYDAGNLKYDADPLPVEEGALAALRAAIGERPFWVAASTHATEETHIAQMHRALQQRLPSLLTVIIPRHAVRGDGIAETLRGENICIAQRSKNDPITPDTQIYLADTMGELGLFFRASPIVFMGGSLIPHGGQNCLEPARLGCAILTGPYTHNFTAIIEHLLQAEAVLRVSDTEALTEALYSLFHTPSMGENLATRALTVTSAARGASTTILTRIEEILSHAHP